MGREVRDSDIIASVGQQLAKSSKDLTTIKNKFLLHVDNMLNNYKGNEATAYANMLKTSINKIDALITAFDYYSKYMLDLADHDVQNVQNTISKIKQEIIKGKVIVDDRDKFIY